MKQSLVIALSSLMMATASLGASAANSSICAADNTSVANRYTVTCRPELKDRLFHSDAVEKEIKRVKKLLTNPKLAWMFENCFPNTIDTTVHYRQDENGKNETFVYTGDIHAMWLRDSGAQVWPYVALAPKDKKLKAMVEFVIRHKFKLI